MLVASNTHDIFYKPRFEQFSFDIVDSLLARFMSKDEPFSSGEIVATIRHHAPELVFSARTIGNYIQNKMAAMRFFGGNYAPYERKTRGVCYLIQDPTAWVQSRTPVNTTVLVYASSEQAAMKHQFEVFIPEPVVQSTPAAAPSVVTKPVSVTATSTAATSASVPRAKTPKPTTISGSSKVKYPVVATVQRDARIYVPRAAFELLASKLNTTIRTGPNGTPIYTFFDASNNIFVIRVTIPDDKVPMTTRKLWTRGKLAFTASGHSPGHKFSTDIVGGAIVIYM